MTKLRRTAARQHGLLTRQQALDAGLTGRMVEGLLRRGEWVRVGRGVYRVSGAPVTARQRLLTAVLVAGAGAAASHTSSAELMGLPGFTADHRHVLRAVERSRKGRRSTLHETNFLPRHHVREIAGIPATTPERTLLDIYAVARHDLCDEAVRAAIRMGLTTLGRLAVVLGEMGGRGRAGTAGLRAVVAKLDDGQPITESELEELVLEVLRPAGLETERQVTIAATTAPIGRVDFLIGGRVVIEADSRAWHGDAISMERDRVRDLKLTAAGYRVIRVSWRVLVDQPELFVDAVRVALRVSAA